MTLQDEIIQTTLEDHLKIVDVHLQHFIEKYNLTKQDIEQDGRCERDPIKNIERYYYKDIFIIGIDYNFKDKSA